MHRASSKSGQIKTVLRVGPSRELAARLTVTVLWGWGFEGVLSPVGQAAAFHCDCRPLVSGPAQSWERCLCAGMPQSPLFLPRVSQFSEQTLLDCCKLWIDCWSSETVASDSFASVLVALAVEGVSRGP